MANVVFLNDTVISKEEDCFKFIDCALAFGVGDADYYLTPIDRSIVWENLYSDWKSWAYAFGLDGEGDIQYDLDNCDEEISNRLIEQFNQERTEWMAKNNLIEEDLVMLELLHKQYEAIVKYTRDNTDMEALRVIRDTYNETRINSLEYLMNLKTVDEWIRMCDRQGSMLAYVMTGIDVNRDESTEKRTELIRAKRQEYLRNIDLVNEICLAKER